LYKNTTGSSNTAHGAYSLGNNTTGNYNTANGVHSLHDNNTGGFNSAFGYGALSNNTTGNYNTANGSRALYSNETGSYNVAIGFDVLFCNTSGNNNAAIGPYSLLYNTIGSYNIGIGRNSLRYNTTGSGNTTVGYHSLYYITTGTYNTAIGYYAGSSAASNTTNSTSVGYGASATASNTVRIGNSNVTSIGGQVSWGTLSDGRFKLNVNEDVPGIEFIQQLKPVSYSWDYEAYEKHSGFNMENDTLLDKADKVEWKKQQNINSKKVYTGFIAQDVEKVTSKMKCNFSAVVAPESEKDHYSIRYAEFVVPLVKATQQQQKQLEELKEENENLKTRAKAIQQELKELKQLIKGLSNNKSSNLKSLAIQSPVLCYPNPTNSKVHIKVENPNTETINNTVYDMSGKVIYANESNNSKLFLEVDLSNENNGTYIIQTKIGTTTYQNRIILQK
jgi:hypothetical protein